MILWCTKPARISPWILVLGGISYCVGFSSADGGLTDGLYDGEHSIFNEDIDPLPRISSYVPDSTDSGLILDLYLNDGNSDGFHDAFSNDSDADSGSYTDPDSDSYWDLESGSDPDLFASSSTNSFSNSILDTTTGDLDAECSSYIDDDNILRKNRKVRVRLRRETACSNPYSESDIPILSLPTLDQSSNREDPSRPATGQDRTVQDSVNDFLSRSGPLFGGPNYFLKMCPPGEKRVCSSNNRRDIHRESEGGGYTLTSSTVGKYSPNLRPTGSVVHVQFGNR